MNSGAFGFFVFVIVIVLSLTALNNPIEKLRNAHLCKAALQRNQVLCTRYRKNPPGFTTGHLCIRRRYREQECVVPFLFTLQSSLLTVL